MKIKSIFDIHRWTVYEDIVVASHAINRKTDPKTIKKLSSLLGLRESQIAARMANYEKLSKGCYPDWHYSKQEKKVFDWLTHNNGLIIKPAK